DGPFPEMDREPTSRRRARRCGSGQLVARLLDGRAHGGLLDLLGAGDGHGARLELDPDVLDAGDLPDLLGDGGDAVAAGHAGDGPGAGGAHGRSFRRMVFDSIPYPPRVLMSIATWGRGSRGERPLRWPWTTPQ